MPDKAVPDGHSDEAVVIVDGRHTAPVTGSARFDAFITYRRKDGSGFASRLRQWLEEYNLPADVRSSRKPRKLVVYQDTAFERATEDFYAKEIRPALLASDHLIVIGTPAARQRRSDGSPNWLEREIEDFLALDPPRPVFAAIAVGQLDDPLPAGLGTHRFENIERVDIRKLSFLNQFWPPANAVVESELLKIVATLCHVPREQMPILRQEEASRRARRAWTYTTAAGIVAVTLLVMLWWTVTALLATQRQLVQYTTLQGINTFSRSPARARLYFARAREIAEGLLLNRLAGVSAPIAQSWLGQSYPERVRTILWHDNAVRVVRFSSDGKWVATGTTRGDAFIWNAHTGARSIGPLRHGGQASVNHVEFSPDGRFLVTTGSDHAVRVWDASSGGAIWTQTVHAGPVMKAAYDRSGSFIVTGALSDEVCAWEAAGGRQRFCVRHSETDRKGVLDVAIDPNGVFIASAGANGTVRLWKSSDGSAFGPVLHHQDAVQSVEFSRDGTRLLSAGWDNTARVWNLPGLEAAHAAPLSHDKRVEDAVFDVAGERILTAGGDGVAHIWSADIGTRRPNIRPMIHGDAVMRALFNPDGTRALTASDDGTARLWDAATGQPLGNPIEHSDRILSADFSPVGGLAATGSMDGTVRIFELVERSRPQVLQQSNLDIQDAAFCPDASCVVTTALGGHWWLWEASTGKLRTHEELSGNVTALAFNQANRLFATGTNDGGLRLWTMASGAAASPELSRGSAVSSLQFGRDGRRFAAATDDGRVRIWSVARLESPERDLGHPNGVTALSFNGAGDRLATTTEDGMVRIWDVASGVAVTGPTSAGAPIQQVAFSANDKHVVLAPRAEPWVMTCLAKTLASCVRLQRSDAPVTAALDGSVRKVGVLFPKDAVQIWNVGDTRPVGSAIEGTFTTIALDARGERLATGGNGEIQVWDVATGQAVGSLIRDEGYVNHLAFSSNGEWLLAGTKSRVRLIRLARSTRSIDEERTAAERETGLALDPATNTPRRLSPEEWKARQH